MHVIVGAGTIGSSVARLLAERGDQVRVITRSGGGPQHPNIERVVADAADAAVLRQLTAGAVALYNCANPPYHTWPTDWPPLAAALLTAAEASGAVLVITGNLYVYGPVDRPMTEDMPLAAPTVKGKVRIRMWQDALAAHRAGRIRVTEIRASDFIAPKNSVLEMSLPALRAGKTVRLPVPLDIPHTFTYTEDVARLMVVAAGDERAWGRPWHVPSSEPMTARELVLRAAKVAKLPEPTVRQIPKPMIRAAALFDSFTREFLEMRYQFERPFVLDSAAATATFGMRATDLDEALRASVAA
ncbi:NAD-dependent epimerase/dehydratase family protein [Micromonospora polyrhachis]|uniref:Nucleoside-diphosphate-sugar epimerase n=1 Tax=Micromonospora polyrhachis TaxID=1282883 RepID=A0A7W7WNW7_9ACTN|nr:NAD-dependent epimerase/dehydratase family protein [Micromonospora polyrhachis]MBB4958067.1 nucleoside-diphosphate-sugar epimerase [Micromonospora polyrhachis]